MPAEARIAYNLGLMYQKQGQLAQAETSLARASAQGDSDASYALALLYARQGKRSLALPLAETLVQMNPGNAQYARLRDELRGGGAAGR